jgi:hypothetical protein
MSRWPVEKLLGDKVAAAMWLPWARNRLRGMNKYVSGKWLINTWKPVADITVQCIKRPVGADEIRIWALQKLGLGFLFDNAENTDVEPSPTRTLLWRGADGTWKAKLANLQRPVTDGSAAANVDWVSANGKTVLNWAGPAQRYFGTGAGDTIYSGGAILTQAPGAIAGAAVNNGWLLVACYVSPGIVVYAKPVSAGNSADLYDAETAPLGWREIGSTSGISDGQIGAYFNNTGTECCKVCGRGATLIVGSITLDSEGMPTCTFASVALGQTGISRTTAGSGDSAPNNSQTSNGQTGNYFGWETITNRCSRPGITLGGYGCNYQHTADYKAWAEELNSGLPLQQCYDDTFWQGNTKIRQLGFISAESGPEWCSPENINDACPWRVEVKDLYQTSTSTHSWQDWGEVETYSGSLALCADYYQGTTRIVAAIIPSGSTNWQWITDGTGIYYDLTGYSYFNNDVQAAFDECVLGGGWLDNTQLTYDITCNYDSNVHYTLSISSSSLDIYKDNQSLSYGSGTANMQWATVLYLDLRYDVIYFEAQRRTGGEDLQGRYIIVNGVEHTLVEYSQAASIGGCGSPGNPAFVGTSTTPITVSWLGSTPGQGLIAIDRAGDVLLSDQGQFQYPPGADTPFHIDALFYDLNVVDPLTLLVDLGYLRGSTEQSTLYGIAYLGEQSAAS